MRVFLAIRAFFVVLFSAGAAARVREALAGPGSAPRSPESLPPAPQPAPSKLPKPAPAPPRPARSEALTLLAALQRDARLVDLVQEPLAEYSDAQIGAAARDVLRDARQVLDRMFALRAVVDDAEGDNVETPADFDAGCYRLTGNVSGSPPFRGRLVHRGWIATRCDLPGWTGGERAARIVAPAELELG